MTPESGRHSEDDSGSDADEPRYTIGVIADMLDLHKQTLRMYEKEGLIDPHRTSGNTRMYSRRDAERIAQIRRFTQEMGLNLAGVDLALRLLDQIEELQRERDRIFSLLRRFMGEDFSRFETLLKRELGEEITDLVPVRERGVVMFEEHEVQTGSEPDPDDSGPPAGDPDRPEE